MLSSLSPMGGAQIVRSLVGEYFRKKRFERERFLRDLKRLQHRELVDYREYPDGKLRITLTKLGKRTTLYYNIDDMKLDTSKRWDGKWRMVIFDVPHYQKNARDAFRRKLAMLRLYPIQKSVFITPYECGKEIDFICSIFNIRQYILIFTINRFEGEEKIKHYFGIG